MPPFLLQGKDTPMDHLIKTLTELTLVPPHSIRIQPDRLSAAVCLSDTQCLQVQTGTAPARDGAQARLVTPDELSRLPAGNMLPLIVAETKGPENAVRCLDSVNAAAVSGSWAEDPAQVRAFFMGLFRFELAHVGINLPSDREALPLAARFAELFNLQQAPNPQSVFCGGAIEVMRAPGPGEHGHLAIRTSHLERAIAYFQRQGWELDTEHPMRRPDGLMMGVYFRRSFGGFALHLMRRV